MLLVVYNNQQGRVLLNAEYVNNPVDFNFVHPLRELQSALGWPWPPWPPHAIRLCTQLTLGVEVSPTSEARAEISVNRGPLSTLQHKLRGEWPSLLPSVFSLYQVTIRFKMKQIHFVFVPF